LHAGHGQWRLAPAFDLNPFPDRVRELKTWISSETGPEATVEALLSVAPYFKIPQARAKEAVRHVERAVARWRKEGRSLGMTDTEILDVFAQSVAAELERTFGTMRFDFLVNNAGTSLHASIAETTAAQIDEVYSVHFKAPFLLTQKLLPLIADGGRILNVSSGLARMTMPGSAAYGAMKAAVETLTRYMAQELGPRKITVNVIAPGAIATDFSGGRVRDNPELNRRVASMTALSRVGQPDDVGGAVAMLLAPESGCGWINGQRIEVSGGMGL
jgi:NAD(P)-dependent dehydrogenase (short-subunit alcohol dehydrogenase family)